MIDARIMGTEAVAAYLRQLGAGAAQEIPATVGRLALKLATKVQMEKLSGQVLKNRTNRLRNSIHAQLTNEAFGARGIVGTNVEYAARHEYGFSGQETVKAHMRTIKQAWGKPLKGGQKAINVRSFSRSVNTKERSFLRSALAEMRPEILAEIDKAMARTLAR